MPPQHYQKIADHLREAINSGQLTTGDELPSEAELCEQFGSSRGPVRQAMMLLRTEGMISTGRGRRSTVLARSGSSDFDSTISISTWLKSFGQTPGQRTLSLLRQPADEDQAELLEVQPGAPLLRIRMSTSDQSGQLISYADNLFDAENFVLHVNTVRGTPSPARLTPVELSLIHI